MHRACYERRTVPSAKHGHAVVACSAGSDASTAVRLRAPKEQQTCAARRQVITAPLAPFAGLAPLRAVASDCTRLSPAQGRRFRCFAPDTVRHVPSSQRSWARPEHDPSGH